ncbi:mig-17, partial [Pristionchus pacificus]
FRSILNSETMQVRLLWLLLGLTLSDAGVVFTRKEINKGVVFRKAHKLVLSEPDRPIYRDKLGIDLLFMADHSEFEAFFEMSNNNEEQATAALNDYMKVLFEQLRLIFADFHESHSFELRMVGTFVASRRDDCPLKNGFVDYDSAFNSTTDSNVTLSDDFSDGFDESEMGNTTDMSYSLSSATALNKLTNWIKVNYDLFPVHDHAIMLTKFDLLTTAGDSATQGIAYVRQMCRPGESSSVIEDVGGMATAVIAAHELVHSLGAFHDGLEVESSDCPVYHNFLMSPSPRAGENAYKLSSCSQNHIESFLKDPASWCVHKRLQITPQPAAPPPPGANFTTGQVCQVAFGPHYSVCPNPRQHSSAPLCQQQWCKDRSRKRFEPCETKPFLPAFDGTPCGMGKWCHRGECVVNPNWAKQCQDINGKTCLKYSKAKLKHYCGNPEFAKLCCSSCMSIKS